MKKTQKKVLGLAGLFFVAAMTAFAVALPSPGAVAINSSVTDTIEVRVVATTPNVEITKPKNGQVLVDPDQTIDYTYENISTAVITLEYTDLNGNVITKTLATIDTGSQPGSGSFPISLYEDYGYGDYIIKIIGTGNDGVTDEDIIKFSFHPVTGEANQIEDTNKVKIDADYDTNNDDIDHIEINIYDKDGNLITPLSPVIVNKPDKTIDLPFGDLPSGSYTIEITAIGTDGTRLLPSFSTTIDYKKPDSKEPVIPVPDTGNTPNTGGLFGNLNISNSDFLITGLIIFFFTAICGIIIISKRKENKNHRR